MMSATEQAPLAGVRVVDLTMAWAGPMAVRSLAQLGAQVVKIEAAGKMDRWRGGTFVQRGTERYPDNDPGPRPWNRNAYFNSQNLNKLGVTLDLKSARGREVFLRLVRQADVVTENFAFGAMRRLGLDYDTLAAQRPGLLMLSMPGFGRSGPERDYIAHGPTIEQLAGNAFLQGYPDGGPLTSGRLAWGDPVAGMTAAAMVVFGLWRRSVTGRGGHIDLSQLEAGVVFNFDSVIGAVNGGDTPRRLGTGHRHLVPHGTYRCAGEDRWVAIACRGREDWARLCEVVGSPALSGDPELAELVARRRSAALIDAELTRWCAGLDPVEAATRLQRAGVPAGPVLDAADLLADPQLAAREFFVRTTHPEAGTHRYVGLPWRYAGNPAWWRQARPAPCFGEHNQSVLTGLGLSADEVARLAADGVIATEPAPQGD